MTKSHHITQKVKIAENRLKTFIKSYPVLYHPARLTKRLFNVKHHIHSVKRRGRQIYHALICAIKAIKHQIKKRLFSPINFLLFPRIYHYYSNKLHQIPVRQQVFLICRHDLGAIAMTLHYAALWKSKRNQVVLINISPEAEFTKKMAAHICPHLKMISYDNWFLHKVLLRLFKFETYLKSLIKVNSILLSERQNAVFLYNTQDWMKVRHEHSIGEYNRYFDKNQEILKDKPEDFQKSYYRFRYSFFYEYEKYNDYKDLIYQSKPIEKTPELKKHLQELKKKLKIADHFVVLNINQKNYNNPIMNRRRVEHPKRFNVVIDYLIAQGYTVVIQGRGEQPKLKPRPNLVNYARSSYTSVENDLALLSGAQFMISSKTGPETFASFYHTPILGVNYVEFPLMIHAIRYRYVFQKILNPKTNEILSWKDILTNPAFFDYGNISFNPKLKYLEMSEEDLLKAVQEFIPLLSLPDQGWLNYTDKQKEFISQLDPTHIDLYHCKGAPCNFWLSQTNTSEKRKHCATKKLTHSR